MIEIEDYCEQAPGQSTVAIFTTYLPAARMRIRKMRLIKLKSGHYKVAMPSFQMNRDQMFSNEKPIFKHYVEFSSEKQKEFEIKVLEALKPFLKSV